MPDRVCTLSCTYWRQSHSNCNCSTVLDLKLGVFLHFSMILWITREISSILIRFWRFGEKKRPKDLFALRISSNCMRTWAGGIVPPRQGWLGRGLHCWGFALVVLTLNTQLRAKLERRFGSTGDDLGLICPCWATPSERFLKFQFFFIFVVEQMVCWIFALHCESVSCEGALCIIDALWLEHLCQYMYRFWALMPIYIDFLCVIDLCRSMMTDMTDIRLIFDWYFRTICLQINNYNSNLVIRCLWRIKEASVQSDDWCFCTWYH